MLNYHLLCQFESAALVFIEITMDAATASSDRSILPEKPHQPRAFHFPKREYGKKSVVRRSFQTAWFDKWPCLHYREENDSVLCHTCLKAKVSRSCHGLQMLYRGFTNWKDAILVRFSGHEASIGHKEAFLKGTTLPASKRLLERRQCFLKILSNVRYLARQGL